MKIFLVSIVAIFFQAVAFSQTTTIRPQNPEELGEAVFKSFQDSSYTEFQSYIFTDDDCDIMAANADAPRVAKDTVVLQMKGLVQDIREKSKRNFEEILLKAKEKGINWQKTRLIKVYYEISNHSNIETSDLVLGCKFEDIIFGIGLDNCSKSDAWLMMGAAEIRFKN